MNRTADQHPPIILAPPLKRGDTIGLVSPAGPLLRVEEFAAGVRILNEMGFKTRFTNDLGTRRDGYLAGTDDERAREFNELWAEREVKAMIAVRGGYGSQRLLDKIDFGLIRKQPKLLIGFSDISVLINAVSKQTGLVTFHGPMATTLAGSDNDSVKAFFEALSGREPETMKPQGLEILVPGNVPGRLLGGNLTSLVHTLATPHEIDWQNAVLFLEDIGEAPYRIDRMLTHLWEAGRLQNIAGLILGDFQNCGDVEIIWERVIELLQGQDIPIWANFPCGHGPHNRILPLGVSVEMDSSHGTLHFRGPCTAS